MENPAKMSLEENTSERENDGKTESKKKITRQICDENYEAEFLKKSREKKRRLATKEETKA